jgi:hypothetical protein
MITDKIKELASFKSKVEALEAEVAKQLQAELAGLPAQYGYDSLNGFIKAVKKAGGGRSSFKAPKVAGGKRRRRRAKITPEMKDGIKAAVKAGKTGAEIAKEFGISLPSVQNVKKELGLVKARGKK